MDKSIGKRISIVIEVLRMNTSSFSKSLGRSYTAIESIVKEKSKPGYELLESIITTHPTVNPAWLLTGEGEPLIKDNKQDTIQSDNYLKEHLQALEENFNRLASQLETKDHQLETKDDQIKSKDDQIKSLTRMLESVLGKPSDVAAAGSVVRVHPATQQMVEPVGATA